MGFTVSSLTDYVDQTSTELIQATHFMGKTIGLIPNVQTGIKTSKALQIFDVTAVPQLDSACSFNASGDIAFTQRNITVGAIKYQDTLCPITLRAKWTQMLLRQGSTNENDLTFEADIVRGLNELTAEHNETRVWQGDTGSGSAYLDGHDGFIKLIDAGSPVNGNTGAVTVATGFTVANAIAIVDAMCDALPAALQGKQDLTLFMGWDHFNIYINALKAANYYHYSADNVSGEVTVAGKNIKIVAVHGLDSTSRMFLLQTKNMYLGVDLEGEDEKFEMWESKDDQNVKYSIKYKMGVQVAFDTEVVEFTLVP